MASSLVTNSLYTIHLTMSLSATWLSLLKSAGAALRSPISILCTSAIKVTKSDFAVKWDVLTPAASVTYAFVA